MEEIKKAQPVIYKGIQFRSKMEARLAVLLDEFNADWEYEPIQEDGYTPDFRIKNVEKVLECRGFKCDKSDLYVEVKYALFKGNARQLENFAEKHHIIIGGRLPLKQSLNNWDSFVDSFSEIGNTVCKGENPNEIKYWNWEMIDGSDEQAMLVVMADGNIKLARELEYGGYISVGIDTEKTLAAYQKAQSYCFEAITEKQQEIIDMQKKEIDELKKHQKKEIQPNKKEKLTVRKQLLLPPTLSKTIVNMAWDQHLSFNNFVNQVLEQIAEKGANWV